MTEQAEPQVKEVARDVNIRQVRGGYVVILVTRTTFDNGQISAIQEDTVAGSPSEAASRATEFLNS